MSTKRKKTKVQENNTGDNLSFSSPWHFSDVVLVAEGRKFHVHKSTLSMWSKVFERMFTSNFKEKSALEIPLPGKKAIEIQALLVMMYVKEESVNNGNLEILLKFADEYEMEKLTNMCTDYMKNSLLRKETAMHVYALARRFNLTSRLKGVCMEHLKLWQSKVMEANGHFSEFSLEEKYEMMSNRLVAIEKAIDSCFNESAWSFSRNKLDKFLFVETCEICKSSQTDTYQLYYRN